MGDLNEAYLEPLVDRVRVGTIDKHLARERKFGSVVAVTRSDEAEAVQNL